MSQRYITETGGGTIVPEALGRCDHLARVRDDIARNLVEICGVKDSVAKNWAPLFAVYVAVELGLLNPPIKSRLSFQNLATQDNLLLVAPRLAGSTGHLLYQQYYGPFRVWLRQQRGRVRAV